MRDKDRDDYGIYFPRWTIRIYACSLRADDAPATFQKALDTILSLFKWQTCLVYLDDIIIFSKCIEDHIDHADLGITGLKEAGISLVWTSASFLLVKVKYPRPYCPPWNLGG